MARKTVYVSDQSGDPIPDGKGAKVRITFNDARKGARELDLTDAEAERVGCTNSAVYANPVDLQGDRISAPHRVSSIPGPQAHTRRRLVEGPVQSP